MSKVTYICFGFALINSVIGYKNLHHFFNQFTEINQTNRDLLACVYPRLVSDTYLFVSYSECFMTLFGSVMNDQRDSDFSEFGVLD